MMSEIKIIQKDWKNSESVPPENVLLQWITKWGDVVKGFYKNGLFFPGDYIELANRPVEYKPDYWRVGAD
jgi:hypothetical protein